MLTPEDLTSLQQAYSQQAYSQETAGLAAFAASADNAQHQLFANTVSGAAVDQAAAQETLAEYAATANLSAPLTRNTGLGAATWYGDTQASPDGSSE